MADTVTKPHLSASQMESHSRCPAAYERRYICGEIIPPGIALLKGSGFHRGAETNMRQKVESHRDLSAKDIVAAAVAAFDLQTNAGFVLSDDEASRGAPVVLGEAKDSLAVMAECHAKEQAPDYQPVLVEETVRIALPGPRDLLGIIDLADDRNRVVDFKTAGRKKSQSDADDSVQLSVYAAAFQGRTGKPPAEVRLDCVVQTKTKTTRDVVVSQRTEADFVALANRINATSAAIQSGIFPPTTPGAWWCGPRFCGYFSTCPFVNSERQALAERNKP